MSRNVAPQSAQDGTPALPAEYMAPAFWGDCDRHGTAFPPV